MFIVFVDIFDPQIKVHTMCVIFVVWNCSSAFYCKHVVGSLINLYYTHCFPNWSTKYLPNTHSLQLPLIITKT